MLLEILEFTLLSPLNMAIFVLWLFSAFFDYGELIYIAQLKEYRLDRFKDFLSTKQGRKFWFRYARMMRIIFAFVALLWPINDIPTMKYMLVSLLIVDITYAMYGGLKYHLTRPVLTLKVVIIFLASLAVEGLLLIITRDWALPFFVLIIRTFLLATVVWVLSFPTTWIKYIIVAKAKRKMERNKKVKVVGITGSYGKSTVKEFTAQLLVKKYKVLKTPKNINTEIGIAKFILESDFSNIDIFVVEMGAYTIGEIKLISEMVKPTVGVLTAINEQHLSLFGSIENTIKAKYELLEALPNDGLAIVNVDNELCREGLSRLNTKVRTYGSDSDCAPTVRIINVENMNGGGRIEGKVEFDNTIYTVDLPILGKHNFWNFVAAGLVAGHFGFTYDDIKDQTKNISLPERTLGEFEYGNCTIIDDSYNSNPDGFKAALAHLGTYSSTRKRVVITRGMLELGGKSEEIHEQIAGEIDFVTDVLVIINEDYSDSLQKGVVGKYRTDILLRYEDESLLKYIKSLKHTDSVILLENRIPQKVYNEITGATRKNQNDT